VACGKTITTMNPVAGTFFGVSFPSAEAAQSVVDGFRQVMAGFPNQKLFLNDNLFTVGHSRGFLDDPVFMAAVERNRPDKVEQAIIWRTHVMAWAARSALRQPGDFVECGCYKGYTTSVLCDLLDWKTTGRTFWLYDLFNPSGADGEGGRMTHHSEDLHRHVVDRFAALDSVKVIKGRVPDSFAQGSPEQIAFLHIDMNNAHAEVSAMETLFPRVSPGGVVIFDDYGWDVYKDQKAAHDAFLAPLGYHILELPTGQGMVIK
jgi:O-methyltransferase